MRTLHIRLATNMSHFESWPSPSLPRPLRNLHEMWRRYYVQSHCWHNSPATSMIRTQLKCPNTFSTNKQANKQIYIWCTYLRMKWLSSGNGNEDDGMELVSEAPGTFSLHFDMNWTQWQCTSNSGDWQATEWMAGCIDGRTDGRTAGRPNDICIHIRARITSRILTHAPHTEATSTRLLSHSHLTIDHQVRYVTFGSTRSRLRLASQSLSSSTTCGQRHLRVFQRFSADKVLAFANCNAKQTQLMQSLFDAQENLLKFSVKSGIACLHYFPHDKNGQIYIFLNPH